MKSTPDTPQKLLGFCRTAQAYVLAALHIDAKLCQDGVWGAHHDQLLTAAEALDAILDKTEQAPEQELLKSQSPLK